MDIENSLTNENIKSKFKSQFELVNYSILMAEQLIRSGRAPRVDIDNLNPAVVVVEEIEEGEDTLEPIAALPVESVQKETSTKERISREKKEESSYEGKSSSKQKGDQPVEKRKTRRILTA